MHRHIKHTSLFTLLALGSLAFALDGDIGIHDPSTVVMCDGKFYAYGTGGSSLVSDDGWTWRRGKHSHAADSRPTSFTSATDTTSTSQPISALSPKPPSI